MPTPDQPTATDSPAEPNLDEPTSTKTRRRPWKRWLIKTAWLTGLLLPLLWTIRLFFGDAAAVDSTKETTYFEVELNSNGTLNLSKLVREHCNCLIDSEDNAAEGLLSLDSFEKWDSVLEHRLVPSDSKFDLYDKATDLRIPKIDISAAKPRLNSARLWTEHDEPALAVLLDEWQPEMDAWQQSIERPSISKPVGVMIDTVQQRILDGSNVFLLRARHHAAKGRWKAAINDLKIVDRAAIHLSQLQCGWFIGEACFLRQRVARCLAFMILSQQSIGPEVAEFAKSRQEWSYREACATATDRAMRMQWMNSATDIHNDHNRLAPFLQGALAKQPQAAQLQIKRVHNGIDWTATMKNINTAVSHAVDAMRAEHGQDAKKIWNDRINTLKPKTTIAEAVKANHLTLPPDVSRELAWFVISSQRRVDKPMQARQYIEDSRATVQVAFAVRHWRDQHGSDPKSTKELGDLIKTVLPTDAGGHRIKIARNPDSLIIQCRQPLHVESLGTQN